MNDAGIRRQSSPLGHWCLLRLEGERAMPRLSRMKLRVVTIPLLLAGSLASVPVLAQQPADTVDQAIDLGSQNQDLGEIDRFPLQITGFGVGNYAYDGRTGNNSFAASKVAVALFREITSRAYVFGQLTTALTEPEAGG